MGEYGISQSVPRFEDPTFLTGRGDFTDDSDAHGQLHAVVVRSPYAHARIQSINISDAVSAPGVIAVYTGRDYKGAGWGPVPHLGPPVKRRGGADLKLPEYWPLAVDRVRMAGEGVADVLFGDASPTGKLSFSWPKNVGQLPLNDGDKNYDALFPFGHGLTY